MNQKCLGKIEKISSVFGELADALDQLKVAVENDDEDQVNETMDAFPSPKQLARALEDLGILISGRPWESKRKGRADG